MTVNEDYNGTRYETSGGIQWQANARLLVGPESNCTSYEETNLRLLEGVRFSLTNDS